MRGKELVLSLSKEVAQGMATDLLVNRRPRGRLSHGLLDQVLVDRVPPHLTVARINRSPGQPERLQYPFWTCLSKVFQAENWQSLSPSSHKMANDPAVPCSPPRTPGKLPKKHGGLWNCGYP